MSDTSGASKASGSHGGDGNSAAKSILGAEGETSQKPGVSGSGDEPPLRKKTYSVNPSGGALKENVPPPDASKIAGSDREPSPMGERKILQENVSTASGAQGLDTSQENVPAHDEKVSNRRIFKLKNVEHDVSALVVSPKPKSQGDEESAMDCSADSSYEIIIHGAKTGPPKPKKDPRDNLGKFHPMLVSTSVSDLWAFDAFIGRSGAFFVEETDKTKSYRCQEKYLLPGEDDESDLEKSVDLDSAEDFLNLSAGVNALGGAVCKGHFKMHKLSNQIYRVKTSSDSLCNRCRLMVPVPGLPPGQALRILKDQLDIEPFLEEVDDDKSSYKVAWIHKRFGTLITAEYKEILTLSKFGDCVSIAVEVGSRIMRRDSMFFPFAYLVGNDLSSQDIERFLKTVIEKCNLSTSSYIFTSNNHAMFAGICSFSFWDSVKVLPNFFTVIEQLRESWLGKDRGISDFNNSFGFASYINDVRKALCKKVVGQAYPTVEKALEDSLGLEYCEIPNIKQIIEVSEDYVRNIHEADIFDLEYDKLSTKEDYVLCLEFISKQPFEIMVRYLDNCSTFRGNHIVLMMPNFVNT